MTEIEVYQALLKRMTGEDVKIELDENNVWNVFDNWGRYAFWSNLQETVWIYAESIATDILAYVNEPDDALDSHALALKRHYLKLLGGWNDD